jgi:hypothetical protein
MAEKGAVSEAQADPSGARDAIERYRDLAKYLITVFAAIGGLLLAGTQLTTVGSLSFEHTPWRIAAAIAGGAVALGAAFLIVWRALRVLMPVGLAFDDVRKGVLAGKFQVRPEELTPFLSVEELAVAMEVAEGGSPLAAALRAEGASLVDQAAVQSVGEIFEISKKAMAFGAVAAIVGIGLFVWGVNPPKEETEPAPDPIVRPVPQPVTLALTRPGREVLDDSLGKRCVEHRISAISVGGTEDRPRVVTLARDGCRLAQFSLPPNWGKATGTERAPASSGGGRQSH